MSIKCVHRETRETPAEYKSTNPASCVICGYVHDLDDDNGFQTNDDDSIVCIGRCASLYEMKQNEQKFAEYLRSGNVADRVRVLMANPVEGTAKALTLQVIDAAGELDTNGIDGLISDLEEATFALEQNNSTVAVNYFQSALANVERLVA